MRRQVIATTTTDVGCAPSLKILPRRRHHQQLQQETYPSEYVIALSPSNTRLRKSTVFDCAIIFYRNVAKISTVSFLCHCSFFGVSITTVYCRQPSFSAAAASSIWNSLPEHIVNASTLQSFQHHLKTFLFRRSFPDILP